MLPTFVISSVSLSLAMVQLVAAWCCEPYHSDSDVDALDPQAGTGTRATANDGPDVTISTDPASAHPESTPPPLVQVADTSSTRREHSSPSVSDRTVRSLTGNRHSQV